MSDGYVFHIDGPLSLFSATTKYGVAGRDVPAVATVVLGFPSRGRAALGPAARAAELLSRLARRPGHAPEQDTGMYVPAEIRRLSSDSARSPRPGRSSESTDLIELGREGIWVPDYRAVHTGDGNRRIHRGPGLLEAVEPRATDAAFAAVTARRGIVLAISERLKVDEDAIGGLQGPILRFKRSRTPRSWRRYSMRLSTGAPSSTRSRSLLRRRI